MTTHQKSLDKAKVQLMTTPDAAFFTAICFSLQHVWDEKIPTACTDGYRIRFNPEFFNGLNKREQLFLLLHETLHVAFQHMTRRNERDPRLWNSAADYVINYILVSRGFAMPEGGLYDSQYADMSTEEVYKALKDQAEDTGDTPELPWEDVEEPEEGDETAIAETQEKIDDLLVKASIQSEMAEDKAGTVPGNLDWYINSLRNPTLPWHQLLARLVTKTIKRGFNWQKPNRRFFPNHLLPSRNSKRLCDLVVAMDISGSVNDDQFHLFCSEVYEILISHKPSSMKLIQFDTDIRKIDDISSVRDLMRVQFTGGGGTNIEPLIEWTQQNKPTALIVFTDGHFNSCHSNPLAPIFWIIHNNPYWKAPYGKVIHHHIPR